ncbi:hypothetical protein L1987_08019 [Smallanthus sonchifolius]|uniref:Uncharacterized protein n=1 Tax=Smallanthus sonchifolius TaxID=185202 RepID=A0ACB9JL86_9ASTR|nr:hypothetical protein L1987_08019 [Smallanthus sonchifolius]
MRNLVHRPKMMILTLAINSEIEDNIIMKLNKNATSCSEINNIMDDFLEMERIASLSEAKWFDLQKELTMVNESKEMLESEIVNMEKNA